MTAMIASVVLESDTHEEHLCLQTVINPNTGNHVTGFGPGPAMTSWLDAHGGEFSYRTHFDWVADFPPWAIEFFFEDQSAALLFKLTWA